MHKKGIESLIYHINPMTKEEYDRISKINMQEAKDLVAQVTCYNKVVILEGCRKLGNNYHDDVIKYFGWDAKTQQLTCRYEFGPDVSLTRQDAVDHIFNYLMLKYQYMISWV